ncbi:MAG: M48 family metallopeptidase, partial [Erysipelotrichaceae bacterium]
FILLILLLSGFFKALETFSVKPISNGIIQTLIFLGIFMGLQIVMALPFAWFDTFKIEAKYGFNKTSVKTFWLDQVKGLFIGAFLMGAFVYGMQMLYLTFSSQLYNFILYTWIFVSLIMIITFVLYTKVFVRLFNKLKPIEDGQLKDEIKAMAIETGFSIKAISVMDASKRSTKLNASFSGLGKTREVVLFDTLMAKLSDKQILAVLAHELGHAKHKDTIRMLFIQILVFGVYALGIGLILQSPELFRAFGLSGINFGFAIILFTILIEPVSLLISIPVSALSRRAEYKADAFAVKLTNKEDMVEAFKILVTENYSNLSPHPLYVLLHYSHPPISQRLGAINR